MMRHEAFEPNEPVSGVSSTRSEEGVRPPTRPLWITRVEGIRRRQIEDIVVDEVKLSLTIDGQEAVELPCSPTNLKELVTGYLFTTGRIRSANEVGRMVIDRQNWIARIVLSKSFQRDPGSVCPVQSREAGNGASCQSAAGSSRVPWQKAASPLTIDVRWIYEAMDMLQTSSHVYLTTGGTHSAALLNRHRVIVVREDISRHNAIDKVVGYSLLSGEFMADKSLAMSCRVSSCILIKTSRCGIPAVISRSAPTAEAVRLSREMNITLIGFARGQRMNVYSGEERVVV